LMEKLGFEGVIHIKSAKNECKWQHLHIKSAKMGKTGKMADFTYKECEK
jgi:hypothetical protein